MERYIKEGDSLVKMTYFRMRMDIRKILEIEMAQDHESYQHKLGAILTKHFAPKLKLFDNCAILANRYNLDPRELYLAAINAEHSGELSVMIPQIAQNISVEEAFNKLLRHTNPVAWAGIDAAGLPTCIYLTEPDTRINTIELPIKSGVGEQDER